MGKKLLASWATENSLGKGRVHWCSSLSFIHFIEVFPLLWSEIKLARCQKYACVYIYIPLFLWYSLKFAASRKENTVCFSLLLPPWLLLWTRDLGSPCRYFWVCLWVLLKTRFCLCFPFPWSQEERGSCRAPAATSSWWLLLSCPSQLFWYLTCSSSFSLWDSLFFLSLL